MSHLVGPWSSLQTAVLKCPRTGLRENCRPVRSSLLGSFPVGPPGPPDRCEHCPCHHYPYSSVPHSLLLSSPYPAIHHGPLPFFTNARPFTTVPSSSYPFSAVQTHPQPCVPRAPALYSYLSPYRVRHPFQRQWFYPKTAVLPLG